MRQRPQLPEGLGQHREEGAQVKRRQCPQLAEGFRQHREGEAVLQVKLRQCPQQQAERLGQCRKGTAG
eukprot:CAMPEP_0171772568 /NCGR_PEP_ID=MMETSP0991-20121206/54764_1 /TAXON_ID=483369 /ORGANISM="non described non described, Strain CCMP2098" /LENGTH=67 /DNA_ID=CAMNT_0012378117 /DNA_START=402 /DNA_END=605 /DNA_ORIENTATION=+